MARSDHKALELIEDKNNAKFFELYLKLCKS